MMKKRLLCALLLLALALSLLPTVALADDAYTAGTAEELQSLLGQRKTPIKLTDNINLKGQPLTISGGNITIDMAGHTISGGELTVDVRETRPLNLTGEGVIDCPDLPLNVSRSALQNDGFVKKISEYITKKVADKLIGMCKTEKESYEKYWDDISPFIKFGCLKDTKFCDKMNDYILFKNLDDKYLTLPELLVKEEEKKDDAEVLDKDGNPITNTGDAAASDHTADGSDTSADSEKDERKVIYYVTDKVQQGQYIKLFKEQNMQAVILDHNIDTSFITQLEQRNEKYKFMRIDADVTESLKDETSAEDLKAETDALTEVFKKALNNDKLTVKVEKLKNENISSIITLSEEGRRMQDMMKMYAMNGMGGMDMNMFAADQTLTLNANNELVKYIFEHKDSENVPMFCEQLYDLAVLSNHPLSVDEMTKFVERSNKIMMLLAK